MARFNSDLLRTEETTGSSESAQKTSRLENKVPTGKAGLKGFQHRDILGDRVWLHIPQICPPPPTQSGTPAVMMIRMTVIVCVDQEVQRSPLPLGQHPASSPLPQPLLKPAQSCQSTLADRLHQGCSLSILNTERWAVRSQNAGL